MHRSKTKYIFALFLCFILHELLAQTTQEETKHALYISSYAPTYAWGDSVAKGVTQKFRDRNDVVLFVEYLDSKRFGKTLFQQYHDLFRNKYQNIDFEVVITSDNNALDFVLQYPELFPDVPVVFCGVNNPQDYDFAGRPFYGIKEGEYYGATLHMILDLLPDVKTLYFMYDNTETSLIGIKRIKELERDFASRVKFEYLSGSNLKTAIGQVKNFDPDGAIAIIDIYFRNETDPISPEEVVREIAAISPVPIFVGREGTLGKGVVGGVFSNGVQHGEDAAMLALKFVDNPAYVPNKLLEKRGKYVFDYNALMKYGINIDDIPEHATIINQPTNLRKYLRLILALLGFTVFQAIIIIILVRNIQLRKKTQRELQSSYAVMQNQNADLKEANEAVLDMFSNLQETNSKLEEAKDEAEKAKRKAERSDRLKTAFLENMSHEVRTPMNGIIGFSEMLVGKDSDPESRAAYARIVQQSCYQLLRIIDDILEISHLSTAQVETSETAFCLNEVLQEVVEQFLCEVRERNVPIQFGQTLQPEHSYIQSDKSKLKKILQNLIENALKFTERGEVEIGSSVLANKLTIYVKDTGIGISPENMDLIFERFIQEDKGISRQYGGLGLGLSIAKENVELLGGKITVESEKGKGSTFYVIIPYYPLGEPLPRQRKEITKAVPEKKAKVILVAEDEEVNYLYLEVLLREKAGFRCELIHARDGEEVLAICSARNDIDLVLMDIKMPVMNGHETAEKIKQQFPHLPVIAQTAYSTDADRAMALRHGCDDFISKPIDKDQLFELIDRY